MKINGIQFPDEMTTNEIVITLQDRLTDLEMEISNNFSEDQQIRMNKNPLGAKWFWENYFRTNPSKKHQRLVDAYEEVTGNSWWD